jgi:uncharacterized protein
MNPTAKQHRLHQKYGPWAVVTGASDGIGREIAIQLAEAGLNLVLVARRRERLEALGNELTRLHGIQVQVIAANLSDAAEIERVNIATAPLEVGLFVAAAGFGTSGSLVNANLETELEMVDLNIRTVLAQTHTFAQRFVARKRGGIILFSSLVAFQGVPRAANYAATKAYVQSLAEGLSVELSPLGVDVLASAPGPVASGFSARADMRMGATLNPREVARATLDALGKRVTVRPGLLSQLLEWALFPLPRPLRVRMMTLVMNGMTKHHA